MKENKSLIAPSMSGIVAEIKTVLESARSNVARQVNSELLNTYWTIGRIIAEYEQTVPERADYGKQTLRELSRALTAEVGKGFSVSNLQFMRRFYQTYQIQQTLSVKLSWSHYCELLSISDSDKRRFYEKEAINSGWSVHELKRQIESSLFERLLLSRGDANKEQVLALAEKGIEIAEPAGQINMYLNYYASEVNDPDDNPPIGIILCAEKDSITAEYALGGLSNNVFASRYVLYMPEKEQLIAQVEKVLERWRKKDNMSGEQAMDNNSKRTYDKASMGNGMPLTLWR